jgi:photosystem II stability/assembly factor-like uncharacterized protein
MTRVAILLALAAAGVFACAAANPVEDSGGSDSGRDGAVDSTRPDVSRSDVRQPDVGRAQGDAQLSGDDAGPPMVLPCDRLMSVGMWESITPAELTFSQDFVLDPRHPGTLYVGGVGGIFKSTDCGSTWSRVNRGTNSDATSNGGHWTLAIDPVNPDVLYTGNGYGPGGVYKSDDGGVNWRQVLPDDIREAFVEHGFVERITIDPTNHSHVLVSPHFTCVNGHSAHCMLESTDAGTTWRVLENQPAMAEDSGQVMINSALWFVATDSGLWRTADGGASWGDHPVHGGVVTDSFYVGDNGTFWTTSLNEGVLQSTDQGATWTVLPDSPHVRAIVGNGETLYTSNRNEGSPYQPYQSGSETHPTTWPTYPSPSLPRGGWVLHYDRDHGVLYSSTENNGFWRVKTR